MDAERFKEMLRDHGGISDPDLREKIAHRYAVDSISRGSQPFEDIDEERFRRFLETGGADELVMLTSREEGVNRIEEKLFDPLKDSDQDSGPDEEAE